MQNIFLPFTPSSSSRRMRPLAFNCAAYSQGPNGRVSNGGTVLLQPGWKRFDAVPGTTLSHFRQWKGSRIGLISHLPDVGAADSDAFRFDYFSTGEAMDEAFSRQAGAKIHRRF